MKILTPVVTLLLMLVCYSCQRSAITPAFFSDKTKLDLKSSGGPDSIILRTDVNWTISNEPSWIRIQTRSGAPGTIKIIILVDENRGTGPRTANITISGTGVKPVSLDLSQAGAAIYLQVDKNSIAVNTRGHKDSLLITSNNKWTLAVRSGSDWITADRLSGDSGLTKVYLTLAPNYSSGERAGELNVSGIDPGILSVKVSLQQKLSNTWILVTDSLDNGLNQRRQTGVSFVWDNKIYFGFGLDSSGGNKNFSIFDPRVGKWAPGPVIPAMVGSRQSASCSINDGVAYFILGHFGNFYYNSWSLDMTTGAWKELPSFSSGSILPVCFSISNTLYVGQPAYEKGVLKKYLPSQNGPGSWQNVMSDFPQIQGALYFQSGSNMYLAGGSAPGSFGYKTLYAFDPANNTVKQLSDFPSFFGLTHSGGAAVSLNGKGYVLHAFEFYQYTPETNTWLELKPFRVPNTNQVKGYQMAVVNKTIYGWTEDGSVYKYIP